MCGPAAQVAPRTGGAVSRVRPASRELDQHITRAVAVQQSPDSVAWLLGRHRHVDRRRRVLDHQDGHRCGAPCQGDVDRAFAALPRSAEARGEAQGDINLPRVGGQPAGQRCWRRGLLNHDPRRGEAGQRTRSCPHPVEADIAAPNPCCKTTIATASGHAIRSPCRRGRVATAGR
jgi:hypothetical protein